MRALLGGAAGLAFLTAAALLFTWLALTGGGGRSSASVSPDALVLSPEVGRVIVRVFFWLFAVPIDAFALVAWFFALKRMVRQPPGP